MIVEKAVKMAQMMHIPVLGIVENMSYFTCPDCGKKHSIFGESHIEEVAAKFGIDTIVRMPIDPSFAAAEDRGRAEALDCSALAPMLEKIEAVKK